MKITKLPYGLITRNRLLLSVQLNLTEVTAYIVLSFKNVRSICILMYVPTKFYFYYLIQVENNWTLAAWFVELLGKNSGTGSGAMGLLC